MEFKILSPDDIKYFENCDPQEFITIHKELFTIILKRSGDDVSTDELYDGIPPTLEETKKLFGNGGDVC